MYKNQLQELAQRSCLNLPWYTSIRESPDHVPRFKAIVNFNGENFESPNYCSTLRQAEHSAAEAALISISSLGPSHSLASRILEETGVYKNLLQEIAQRVGSPLPEYTTSRIFTGKVELSGIRFTGEPAKTKKQAQKNAALAAWLSLKQLAPQEASSPSEHENNEVQEQIRTARALQNYCSKHKLPMAVTSATSDKIETILRRLAFSLRKDDMHKLPMANPIGSSLPFKNKLSTPALQPSIPQRPTRSTSKILPFFTSPNRSPSITNTTSSRSPSPEIRTNVAHRFPAIGAVPYVPIRQCRTPYIGVAPPVTVRTIVPVFSAPPPPARPAQVMQPVHIWVDRPVCIRQAVPVSCVAASSSLLEKLQGECMEMLIEAKCDVDESTAVRCIEQLEI